MRTSWLAGIIFIYLSIMIVTLLLDDAYVGTTEVSTFSTLMSANLIPSGDESFLDIIASVPGYIEALWNMLTLNYSMFTGVWGIFRVAYFVLAIPTAYSLLMSIRGTPST